MKPFADAVIEPPQAEMTIDQMQRWLFDIWNRTGGFESVVIDLTGLQATVAELNTLVGINTSTTVQDQLNLKLNIADVGTMAYQQANNVSITGGSLSDVGITNSEVFGDIRRTIGISDEVKIPGASLYTNSSEAENVGSGETDLMEYELFANALGVNGDYLDVEIWGIFAANANNKRIRLYFGSTVIFDTMAIALNDGSWYIKAKVIREELADQNAIASVISSNALLTPTTNFTIPSEDAAIPILIKTTGEGIANADIVQRGMTIKWFAASTQLFTERMIWVQ